MAHRTHLYAAISSGTVTAQTFEQLPTAIIKKKKIYNLEKCLVLFVVFSSCPRADFWSVQNPTLSDKLYRQHKAWVCSKLSHFLRQLRIALLSQAPRCNKASGLPYIAKIQPSSENCHFKEPEK